MEFSLLYCFINTRLQPGGTGRHAQAVLTAFLSSKTVETVFFCLAIAPG
jgi:hypothetical protein